MYFCIYVELNFVILYVHGDEYELRCQRIIIVFGVGSIIFGFLCAL